jgi:arylsulfatase A-like enzyme
VYSGAHAASPNFDAFAGESLVFDDAYTQSPNSAPSMATVLSGLYPFRHGVRYNRMALAADVPTLTEMLARAGYTTAAFVTNVTLSQPFGFARGFETFRYLASQEREDGLLLDTADPEAVDGALAWVRARPPRPFLLWVHLMAPHWPYLPPADLRPEDEGWSGPWFNVLNMSKHEAPVAHRRSSFDRGVYTRLYAAEVVSADRLCGRLLRGLGELGALDGAHVILLADHGEAFGESDVFGHGRSFDQAETRVPLVWRLPGALRSGTRITTTVQLADLVPTLLRLLGVAAPANLDGRDLSGVVLGDVAGDDGFAFTEARYLHSMGVRGLLYAVRTRRRTLWLDAGYRYGGAFDRTLDPAEHDRRAYRTQSDDALHDTLVGFAGAAQRALTTSAPVIKVDAVNEERLRALGYVQ